MVGRFLFPVVTDFFIKMLSMIESSFFPASFNFIKLIAVFPLNMRSTNGAYVMNFSLISKKTSAIFVFVPEVEYWPSMYISAAAFNFSLNVSCSL